MASKMTKVGDMAIVVGKAGSEEGTELNVSIYQGGSNFYGYLTGGSPFGATLQDKAAFKWTSNPLGPVVNVAKPKGKGKTDAAPQPAQNDDVKALLAQLLAKM